MNLPTITSYGKYNSDNYGVNSLKVEFDNLDLYFSYRTVIAFRGTSWNNNRGLNVGAGGLFVRQNDWSTTTGKHLNWIDNGDKRNRLQGHKFEALLDQQLKHLGLSIDPDDYPL